MAAGEEEKGGLERNGETLGEQLERPLLDAIGFAFDHRSPGVRGSGSG